LPPSPANWRLAAPGWALQTSASLTPAAGARTTRFYRTQQRLRLARQRSLTGNPPCDPHRAPALSRPSHPRPNVRDDRDTPLLRAGMAQVLGLIWVSREGVSFFAQDWTGQISLKGLRNFLFWRNGSGSLDPHGEEARKRRLEPCRPPPLHLGFHPSRRAPRSSG
jgi:hypothetical protein